MALTQSRARPTVPQQVDGEKSGLDLPLPYKSLWACVNGGLDTEFGYGYSGSVTEAHLGAPAARRHLRAQGFDVQGPRRDADAAPYWERWHLAGIF